jgi:hypothetical protein
MIAIPMSTQSFAERLELTAAIGVPASYLCPVKRDLQVNHAEYFAEIILFPTSVGRPTKAQRIFKGRLGWAVLGNKIGVSITLSYFCI